MLKTYQTLIRYKSTIIQDVKTEVAKSEEELRMKLIRRIPKEYEHKLSKVVIEIRPF